MRLNTRIVIVLLLFFFIGNNSYSQDKSENLGLEYANQAKSFFNKGEDAKSKEAFDKSLEAYKAKKDWKNLIEITNNLIDKSFNKNYFPVGIHAAHQTIKTLEEFAPKQLINCNYMLHDLGIMYDITNELELAKATFEKELEILPLIYPVDSSKAFAKVNQSLGIVHDRLGKPEEAIQFFYKAKKIYEQAVDCEKCKDSVGKLYNSIGAVLFELGEKEKGIQYALDGIEISIEELGENNPKLIRAYINIGMLYYELEEFQKSINHYEKVLFMVEPYRAMLPPTTKSNVVEALNHLGINYTSLDQYDKALEYFKKSLDWSKEVSTERSEFMGISTVVKIGRLHFFKENYEEALRYYSKADSMVQNYQPKYEKTDEVNNMDIIIADLEYQKGLIWKMKENNKKAIPYYQKSIQYQEKVKSRVITHYCHSCMELFNIYRDLGRLDSMQYYYQKTLDISAKTPFDPKKEAFKDFLVREYQEEIVFYTIIYNKIVILEDLIMNQKDKSKQKAYYDEVFELMDILDFVHGENLKKSNFLRGSSSKSLIGNSLKGYLIGMVTAFRYYKDSDQAQYALEKAFFYGQKRKAQSLMLKHLKNEAIGFGTLNEELLKKENDLNNSINFYKKKIIEAEEKNDTASARLYTNNFLFKKELEYENLQRELELNHPEYFEAKYNFQPETIESIQGVLKEDEVLIEYFFTWSDIGVMAISKTGPPQTSYLGFNKEKTSELITAMNALLHNSPMNRKSSRTKFIEIAHQFYNVFIDPIESSLEGKKRIIVIGDGIMNYIPFEILLESKEVKPFKDLDFLIKKYEFVYNYSSTLFAKSVRENTNTGSGIYAFAPVYDTDDGIPALPENNSNPIEGSSLRFIDKDGNYTPLPNSEKEVKSLVEIFKNKQPTAQRKLSLRKDANEVNLKVELEKPYQVVHIAGHSFANLKNPEFSGIACYKDENAEEDGTLFTTEIYNISSKADLVTLSSCESGYGLVENSEGLIGLNRAFVYAGTPNVVFSLWKVYDKVSADLMISFYNNVLSGKSYSASLRLAKLKLLEKGETASPHFWSPYLLIGR